MVVIVGVRVSFRKCRVSSLFEVAFLHVAHVVVVHVASVEFVNECSQAELLHG